jgi:hypothetical protein
MASASRSVWNTGKELVMEVGSSMRLALTLVSLGYLILATPQQFRHYWALWTDPVMWRITRKCFDRWTVIGYTVEVVLWGSACYWAATHILG